MTVCLSPNASRHFNIRKTCESCFFCWKLNCNYQPLSVDSNLKQSSRCLDTWQNKKNKIGYDKLPIVLKKNSSIAHMRKKNKTTRFWMRSSWHQWDWTIFIFHIFFVRCHRMTHYLFNQTIIINIENTYQDVYILI